jgi:hypothetical protein
MSTIAEIKQGTAGRAVGLARAAGAALRERGWAVREGVAHSAGTLDLVADGRWGRAGVLVLVTTHSADSEVVFSKSEPGGGPVTPQTFWLGQDDAAQRRALTLVLERHDAAAAVKQIHKLAYPREVAIMPRITAPNVRLQSSLFRESGDFGAVVDQAFKALDAVHSDLLKNATESIDDDLEFLRPEEATDVIAPMIEQYDLLHNVVITDAAMWCMGERMTACTVVRLEQRGIDHELRWLDVVHASAMDAFFNTLTRHYTNKLGGPKAARFVLPAN